MIQLDPLPMEVDPSHPGVAAAAFQHVDGGHGLGHAGGGLSALAQHHGHGLVADAVVRQVVVVIQVVVLVSVLRLLIGRLPSEIDNL